MQPGIRTTRDQLPRWFSDSLATQPGVTGACERHGFPFRPQMQIKLSQGPSTGGTIRGKLFSKTKKEIADMVCKRGFLGLCQPKRQIGRREDGVS